MEFLSLNILIFAPLIVAGIILSPLFPNDEIIVRRFAKGFSGILFIYSILFMIFFKPYNTGYQFKETIKLFSNTNWIEPLGISLSFGLDGISVMLVVLTTFLVMLALIASKKSITTKHKLYYSLILVLTTAILGIVTSRDLFLFFLFWELELIPMYFLISIWGTGKKEYSAMKFVLYTFFGSLFMLGGILLLNYFHFLNTGIYTFSIEALTYSRHYDIPFIVKALIFLGFFIAFAVKLPIVPLHTWLPNAHVDAPTPVSMLLAGILLKMGGYGLIRFNTQMFPEMIKIFAPMLIVLGVINIIYAAFIALAQKDLKLLIAYSSISHMGFVLLGLGALNTIGITGAMFQMLAHALISAGLFLIVGVIYLRTKTRIFSHLGGLGQVMPKAFYFTMLLALASLGLPLLVGFAAEVMIFYGAFTSNSLDGFILSNQFMTALAAISIIITAAYLLWMLQKIFMGNMFEKWQKAYDLTPQEAIALTFLSIPIVLFGLYPEGVTSLFLPFVDNLVSNLAL